MSIREVIAYEAVCDCGCGEKLFLGARRETMAISLSMNGWSYSDKGKITLAHSHERPKKTVKKGRR